MKDRLPQYADKVEGITGYLEVYEPTYVPASQRVAGSSVMYHCSAGYDLGDNTNPGQIFHCQANLHVDFSAVRQCKRVYYCDC